MGGLRPHSYVYNPTVWVDPAGLYGVYLFETTLNNCYVGKGEPDRMEDSMAYRTKVPPSDVKRCLYVNTDADAAKAGVAPTKYGAMVENQLIASPLGYGAKLSSDWFNQKLDGQAAMRSSSEGQQNAATATAIDIKNTFGPCPTP